MTGKVVIIDLQRYVTRSLRLIQAGGGGNDDGMSPGLSVRIDRLEKDVTEIKGDVKTLSGDMRKLSADVARIDGRVSMLPSTFQIMTWNTSLAITVAGLVFAIVRLAK